MMLRHESLLSLVESLNSDDAVSKCLIISHSYDVGLYTATAETLQIISRAASTVLKDSTKPASFRATTFHTSTEMFLGKQIDVFVVLRTYSALESVAFLNKLMLHIPTMSILLLQIFLVGCVCIAMAQATGKKLEGLSLKVVRARLSKTYRSFFGL